jgi:nitrate/nitrite transport system substrate-binding protein
LYKGEGLNVTLQQGGQAGRWCATGCSIANLTHRTCSRRCRSTISLGRWFATLTPMRVATHPERERPGDRPGAQTQGQSRSAQLERFSNSRSRSTISMHSFLLRYYLAEHGIDPDRDVQLRVTPPAEMIANLRAGNIDGFLGPDPFNQRAVFDEVGFIHILSKEIWAGHPCCSFSAVL